MNMGTAEQVKFINSKGFDILGMMMLDILYLSK